MKKEFNPQKHFDEMLEVESTLVYAFMLCEGMYPANNQMEDKQYMNACVGVFYMLSKALDIAHDMMNEMGIAFREHYGTKWPCEIDKTKPQGV